MLYPDGNSCQYVLTGVFGQEMITIFLIYQGLCNTPGAVDENRHLLKERTCVIGLSSGFQYNFKNILLIQQIENPFIPLYFHWNAR